MREDDVENLEDEPLAFVRQELEGSQRGAKREAAGELVKAMMRHHETEVARILSEAVDQLLAQAKAANVGEDQRLLMKDVASFLVTCSSVKASTRARGVTEVYSSQALGSFFEQEMLPALRQQGEDENAYQALLKSSALRFVALFRNFLPAA